jgi:pyruvyl transferase EpsO
MPQSINFASSVALDQTRTAIKQHGDVVLLLRDRKSEAFARKHFFADIHLVPDAALALPQDKPIFAPRHSVVVLARSDDEASVADTDRASHHVDWIPEPETIRRSFTLRSIMTAVAIAAGPVRGHRGVVANPTRVYDRFAAWNYARGRRLLSSGQVLVTNRLHAHVFALLLQIPHVVVDDKYSKIHNLDTTWLTGAGAVRWAPDLRRAEQVAEDWALELGSPCDNEQ